MDDDTTMFEVMKMPSLYVSCVLISGESGCQISGALLFWNCGNIWYHSIYNVMYVSGITTPHKSLMNRSIWLELSAVTNKQYWFKTYPNQEIPSSIV